MTQWCEDGCDSLSEDRQVCFLRNAVNDNFSIAGKDSDWSILRKETIYI